jgi:hypothetical protein
MSITAKCIIVRFYKYIREIAHTCCIPINETFDLDRDFHLLMVALSRFILLRLIHCTIIHKVSTVWQVVAL